MFKNAPKSLTTVTSFSKVLTGIIMFVLPVIGFMYGVKFQGKGALNKETFLDQSPKRSENLVKQIDENEGIATISGIITIKYRSLNSVEEKDDLYVDIKVTGLEEDPFGIPICKTENDNCIWLISHNGNIKKYGYRFTRGNDMNPIGIGKSYELQISGRVWTESEFNIGLIRSDVESVSSEKAGETIKNFDLEVQYFD